TPESPFGTRCHDDDTVLEIEQGEADLVTTPTGTPERLGRGDTVLVPAGRLYGVKAVADGTACLLHTAAPG
ncbi:hypothetical protein G3I24_30925, partial [Micromonospora aurantiaca]|nr:hypothetical protein [Micromonospora aurantiaca]